jgi:AraC-like DNA-binding protein
MPDAFPRKGGLRVGTLPLLVFGDSTAVADDDVRAFSQRMAQVVTSLRRYVPLGDVAAFRQKSAAITINGLKLVAGACTAVQVEVAESADLTLLIPFSGQSTTVVAGVSHRWQAGASGMFLPGVGGSGSASLRSVLMVDIRHERLQTVACSMLGLAPDAKVEFVLGQARTVDLQWGGMAFGDVFGHLCGLIDAYRGQRQALETAGLDDQFYRHIVMLLRPGLLDDEVLRKSTRPGRILDPVCDYIMAHLHAPISLTDLEIASGLSRRSLQYVFWQRYECTPMQWVRGQRLEKARAMLLVTDADESVTSAALQSGFSNLGAFSAYYRERFGEQPSDTLRRTGARRR